MQAETRNVYSGFAAELVRSRVDVIVTAGEQAALAAKAATSAIPIVVTEFSLDPIKAGLVASLGRPGGNVTGLATQSEELWEKRLGLLEGSGTQGVAACCYLEPGQSGQCGLRRRNHFGGGETWIAAEFHRGE